MNNVPNLRFKEFSEEWRLVKADDVFLHIRNGFVGTATPFYTEFGIPYLQSNNIRKDKIDKTKMVYITEEFHLKNKKSILKTGDILMVQSGHAGECAVVPKEFEGANCHALIVMSPSNKINSTYCSYYMNSTTGQRQISKLITGNTIRHILASEMKEYKIKIPQIKEQEKIASFFSLIDKKIELQTEKVEELKNYKKGIMQKIFSQELRFKDENGNDYPEWEEKKLGAICEITTGKLDANAMIEGGMYRFYTCAKEYFRIDKYAFDTEALLISGNGANVGYIHYYNGKFNAYQRTYVLTNFKENILFIKHYLNRYLKRRILEGKNEGNTPYIVLGTLSEMPLKLPCAREQEKISQFLNPLEYKIEKEQKKLEYLNQYKKGLLQQMFV